MLNIHHLVVDGWSTPILIQDLLTLLNQGEQALPVPRVSYQEIVHQLAARETATARQCWQDVLKGVQPTKLFSDQPHNGKVRELDIVLEPEMEQALSPETIISIKEVNPDYFIVANFQQLLTRELLDIPNAMPINFHPSPLPRYAGLAPFYWMIKNGETKTSISAIKMDEGLDTGDIIMQRSIHFSEKETCIGLRTFQEDQNVLMLLDLIPLMVNNNFSYKPQNMQNRSYFGRPKSSDYHLNFQLEAQILERHIRAAYRHPGAYFLTKKI
ncbi:formyltransferase family protein [Xenorhabdus bovienii]|uniref:formyltransferase family protein n=1 Tax=Xenorhabdus bovienii TaxID=40576 RepID=UPI000AC83D9F|nr:formyltransferase family protein [Xenorhabdus bovienii]